MRIPPQDHEDVVQQAYCQAWRGLPRFRGTAKLSTWFYRIVQTVCLNWTKHLRLEARRLPRLWVDQLGVLDPEGLGDPWEMALDPRPDPEATLLAREAARQTLGGIEQVDQDDQQILALKQEGLSYSEMAAQLGITVCAVKSRLYRARRAAGVPPKKSSGPHGYITTAVIRWIEGHDLCGTEDLREVLKAMGSGPSVKWCHSTVGRLCRDDLLRNCGTSRPGGARWTLGPKAQEWLEHHADA